MLSAYRLRFFDKQIRQAYERDRHIFFKRVMPVIFVIAALLVGSLEFMYRWMQLGNIEMNTTIVNCSAVGFLLLLTLMVRCCYCITGLVNPAITLFTFFWLSEIDYDGVNVSIYYSCVASITLSFFYLIYFNENWFVSTIFYTPCLSYFMWKTGKDMLMAGKQQENLIELTSRCVFCIGFYAIIAYKIELLHKQAYFAKEQIEKTFYRWLGIFETFPEGLSLIRNNQIIYANQSLANLFDLPNGTGYDKKKDPQFDQLKKLLGSLEVTRLGGDDPYQTTPWDFMWGTENGAPFSMVLESKDHVPGIEVNHDGSQTKFLSLNKVPVNISGTRDKLLIVRDLTAMISLQKVMYTKQHLNTFTGKVVRQIQEAAEASSMNLQRMQIKLNQIQSSTAIPLEAQDMLEDTLNEIISVLHRIRDFEHVFSICEGTYSLKEHGFSVKGEFDVISRMAKKELSKNKISLGFDIDENVPPAILASQKVFRNCVLNLVMASAVDTENADITVTASTVNDSLIIEVINNQNDMEEELAQEIQEICEEEVLAIILENENVDMNVQIACVLARQVGWPIDFLSDGCSVKFRVVVPFKFIKGAPVKQSRVPKRVRTPQVIVEEREEIEMAETPRGQTKMEEEEEEEEEGEGEVHEDDEGDEVDEGEGEVDEEEKEGQENVIQPSSDSLSSLKSPTRQEIEDNVTQRNAPQIIFSEPEDVNDVDSDAPASKDCLLINCSDLLTMFEELGLQCDESLLEEQALSQIQHLLEASKEKNKGGQQPYKFIFLDLDDPSFLPGRFMTSFNRSLAEYPKIDMRVFACRASSNERIRKMCREQKMNLIIKPITTNKLQTALGEFLEEEGKIQNQA